jgi:hypothetical protein
MLVEPMSRAGSYMKHTVKIFLLCIAVTGVETADQSVSQSVSQEDRQPVAEPSRQIGNEPVLQ